MTKAIVFISHITEEKEIAQTLKQVIESAFLGLIEVFVSSDADSIRLGGKWLLNITTALKSCKIEILLASPTSVKRPWVNFEAGAGWVRDIPVIPLCHSGMSLETLPMPLSELQGAMATDPDQLRNLVPILADAIDSGPPTFDWTPFVNSVTRYQSAYFAESDKIRAFENASPVPPTHGLLPYELTAFLLIGENSDGTEGGYTNWQIRNAMEKAGYQKITASLAVKSLMRKNLVTECFIESNYSGDPPTLGARITDEGWIWLQQNGDSLGLIVRNDPPPF